eukprot:3081082-Rhodomonas_salina.7
MTDLHHTQCQYRAPRSAGIGRSRTSPREAVPIDTQLVAPFANQYRGTVQGFQGVGGLNLCQRHAVSDLRGNRGDVVVAEIKRVESVEVPDLIACISPGHCIVDAQDNSISIAAVITGNRKASVKDESSITAYGCSARRVADFNTGQSPAGAQPLTCCPGSTICGVSMGHHKVNLPVSPTSAMSV